MNEKNAVNPEQLQKLIKDLQAMIPSTSSSNEYFDDQAWEESWKAYSRKIKQQTSLCTR